MDIIVLTAEVVGLRRYQTVENLLCLLRLKKVQCSKNDAFKSSKVVK